MCTLFDLMGAHSDLSAHRPLLLKKQLARAQKFKSTISPSHQKAFDVHTEEEGNCQQHGADQMKELAF